MAQPEISVSSSVALLEPGMWIFRYLSFAGGDIAPPVSLSESCLGNGAVKFFPSEKVVKNTLVRAGDSIIVQILGARAAILVTEYQLKGQSIKVQIQLDRLDDSTVAAAQASINSGLASNLGRESALSSPTQTSVGIDLELMGHIERKGDVRVRNQWLGDPNGIHRLEGFAISSANIPSGLTLAYSCVGPGDTQPQAAVMGNFVGTRQKAKAITGLAFNTGGPLSPEFVLGGEAAFAGQPPLAIKAGKELTGPTGSEPLLAIKLQITKKAVPSSPWDDPAITQIFRSS